MIVNKTTRNPILIYLSIIVFAMPTALVSCATTDTTVFSDDDRIKKHIGEGRTLFRKKEFDKALKQFEQVLEIKPDSDEVHYLIGAAYFEKYLQSHDKAVLLSGYEEIEKFFKEGENYESNVSDENWQKTYERFGLRIDF